MARPKLPENATISDVLGLLENAEEFVRGALGNMTAFKKKHGSAFVRIGVTGIGAFPHYRVEPAGSADDFLKDFIAGDKNLERHFTAYHGRNHKQLDWGVAELRGEHWSTGIMNYDAIQHLLGELRGFKAKKQKRLSSNDQQAR